MRTLSFAASVTACALCATALVGQPVPSRPSDTARPPTGPAGCPTASATQYGTACVGTVRVPEFCTGWNTNATANTTPAAAPDTWFAHRVVPLAFPRPVIGCDSLSRSTTATGTLTIGLFLANGTTPEATPVRTSTMTVTTTSGFRGGTWAPIVIPPHAAFFIGYRTPSTATLEAEVTSGIPGSYFHGGPSWAGPVTDRRFAWRVRCEGAGTPLPPLIGGTLAKLGTPWTTNLSQARPNAVSVFLVGTARTAQPLPFSNGCTLYVDPLLAMPATTGFFGARSVSFPIANDSALCGLRLRLQFGVRDDPPGNALGWVTTQGREVTIGT